MISVVEKVKSLPRSHSLEPRNVLRPLTIFELGKKAFDWKNHSTYEGEDDEPKSKESLSRQSSLVVVLLLASMSSAKMLMNVLANLMIARPGDKFWNGILLSSAQCVAIFCSRFLLNHLHDMTAFRIISGFAAASYIMMISFPDSDGVT